MCDINDYSFMCWTDDISHFLWKSYKYFLAWGDRQELDNIVKKYNTAECENSDNNKILARKIASISSDLEEKKTDKRKLANKLFRIIRRTL